MRKLRTFDQLLRDLLIEQRVDPSELARRLGGNHADEMLVHRWLNPPYNDPNLTNLQRLASALDLSPAELMSN